MIHLRVSDNVVRQRRKDQKRADLEQQRQDYHREFDFAHEYFPETDIRDINGSDEPEAVAQRNPQTPTTEAPSSTPLLAVTLRPVYLMARSNPRRHSQHLPC